MSMYIAAKTKILISLTVLALAAPSYASAQSAVPLPPNGGPTWKFERDRDRHHHKGGHHGRDRDDWKKHRRSDRRDRDEWGRRGSDKHHWGKRRDERYGKDFYSGDVPAGTYSGSWSAWEDPGNGTYTYSQGNGVGGDGMRIFEVPTRAGPKVLGVTPESFEGACDTSGGVCIIRPGN
ncbi:hypothetical protein [Pseudohoeflea suaedae]|uniref:hypothetical protein n=1 Tax=Pseudohoeflea suaedae TaxID=877384 RepID=UPI00187E5636|nr:hypothetical protein [Pseudohoeflea suaedae]